MTVPGGFLRAATWFPAYLASPRGRLRTAINDARLGSVLEAFPAPGRALDVGAGTGVHGLRLARLGWRVTLLEPAVALLDPVRDAAATLDAPPLQIIAASLEDHTAAEAYDLVVVHHVLEYLPDPLGALAQIERLLAPGGHVSLVVLNRWHEALRRAVRAKDPAAATAVLDGDDPVPSVYGVPRRGFDLEELRGQAGALGLRCVSSSGTFVAGDYWTDSELLAPGRFAAALAFEVEAGRRGPYRSVSRYLHLHLTRAES